MYIILYISLFFYIGFLVLKINGFQLGLEHKLKIFTTEIRYWLSATVTTSTSFMLVAYKHLYKNDYKTLLFTNI